MKLWKLWLVGSIAVMLLAACGNQTIVKDQEQEIADVEDANNEEEAGEDNAGESESEQTLNVEEVLQQSIEAMSALESYSMDMTSNQEVTVNGGEPINIVTSTKSEMSLDPLSLYQITTIEDKDSMMGSMESESYFSSEGFFIFEPIAGQWHKLPNELSADIAALSDIQTNPAVQLEMLQAYADEMTIAEEGNVYIFNFAGAGDQYNEMVAVFGDLMGENMGDMMEELMSMMDIKQLSYEIHIDKDTFYQTKIFMTMEMEMDIDGETMTSVQSMESILSHFNEIGEITVPQEVLDNAEENSLEDLEDFDLEDEEGI